MIAIKTMLIWADEERGKKIAADIGLMCRTDIKSLKYDEDIDVAEVDTDIVVVDFEQIEDKKATSSIVDLIVTLKEKDPSSIFMICGKYSATIKKKLKDAVDIFSGVTSAKIKTDYRSSLDLLIVKKYKINYFLTDFFAPHLIGDLERKGFELVLNETYDRESYKSEFLDLWRSFMFIAPLLQEKNRDMLKKALYTYEERDLTQKEKDAIHSEFFFQFTSLPSLANFSERRLYYLEKSIIEAVFLTVVDFARSVDNSMLFGCHKEADVVRLKIKTHKAFSLKKMTKNSDIYKALALIEPYGDVVVASKEERLVIGEDKELPPEETSEEAKEEDSLTFHIFIKVILPHRRHRGLKRY